MCGIAGIYTQPCASLYHRQLLYQIQKTLSHRGPDDKGIAILPEMGLALVHTRLSVLDLSPAGHQPMWNDDQSVGIVFNGEIYNFLELRYELERKGVFFRSRTDTEVILRGYEVWGIGILERLNGMFAFAIWDGRQRYLWLARDRLGKKPLYFWFDPQKQVLIFSSEIKCLFAWRFIKREVNPKALHCYLALGYVPYPHTMFQGIQKLPPAHWLRYDGKSLEIKRYWAVSDLGKWKAPRGEYCQSIRHAIQQAVQRRLISDVPLGAFLSGGVDSSIVVGLMSRLMSEPVPTFCTAFDVGRRSSKHNMDADTAEVVSKSFGTHHTRLTVKPEGNLLEWMKRAVWHMDEPHGNPTLVTTYLLARLAREQGITVILSGDGGDELFGGYPRYLADRYVFWLRQVPPALRHTIISLTGRTDKGERLVKALRKADIPLRSPQWYLGWWNQFSPEERMNILAPSWCRGSEAPNQVIESVLSQVPACNGQELLSYIDLSLWIAEDSNMRVDKMCMAHALEVRAPLLDYKLVELAMSIPFKHKVKLREGKTLLKETFAYLLPGIVAKRPKRGWISPVYYWVNDLLWDEARRLISWLPQTRIFSPKVVELIKEYPSKNSLKIWMLMVFALWYQQYIEGSSFTCGKVNGV